MKKKEAYIGAVLAAPVVLGMTVFFLAPFILTIKLSFEGAQGGMQNYISVLTSSTYQLAVANTGRFMLIAIPLVILCSLLLAILMREIVKMTMLFQLNLLFPMMIPIGSLVTFLYYMVGEAGLVNQILVKAGGQPKNWMESEAAFAILVILYIWKYTGFNLILIAAGLSMIPKEQEEYAKLEGAKKRQIYSRIVIPQIIPVLYFVFVMSIVNSFKMYRETFLLGGKRPVKSIYFLQHFLNNNFENLNYQRLSVAAISVVLMISVITAVLYHMQKNMES